MKVGQLRVMLEKYPDNFDVILSSDAEGNSFSPLYTLCKGIYIPESSYNGTVISRELYETEYGESKKDNCVCLQPTN